MEIEEIITKIAIKIVTIIQNRHRHKVQNGRGIQQMVAIPSLMKFLHFIEIRHAFRHFFSSAPCDVTFLLSSVYI